LRKNLRQSYLEHEVDLHSCRNKISQLTKELENKEKEMNKPPKAYREIFRVLKDMGI
jgi:ribosomal 50S subunit-associated protein YjgA (DUF615 family)